MVQTTPLDPQNHLALKFSSKGSVSFLSEAEYVNEIIIRSIFLDLLNNVSESRKTT